MRATIVAVLVALLPSLGGCVAWDINGSHGCVGIPPLCQGSN
jgi:hypothetical protein